MRPPKNELLQEFRNVCKEIGWKLTALRFAVYKAMKDNKDHPVVDDVWEKVKREIPVVSRESVYRTLNDFATKGMIAVLDRADVVARYDSNPKRHDHFFCERCGRVFDFEVVDLEKLVKPLVDKTGRVEYIEARVRGVCRDCLNKEQANQNVIE